MKPTDADRLDKLAKAYGTNANHCRHMAEPARNTVLPKRIGCGLKQCGPHWRRRPRQGRGGQSLPLIDSETATGESFPESWVGSGNLENPASESGSGEPQLGLKVFDLNAEGLLKILGT